MVRFSQWDVDAHNRRIAKIDPLQSDIVKKLNEVEDESKLHEQIIQWCNSQWPRCKYVTARMDKPSTLPVGCADFIIFLGGGKCLVVECKKKGGKLDADQLAWKKEMEMLGWPVHVIRSMDEFLLLVSASKI